MSQIGHTIRSEVKNEALTTMRNPFASDHVRNVTATKCSGLIILAVFVLAFFVGCGSQNLRIGKDQMLPESHKEKFLLDAPFDRVWQVVSEEAGICADRILVFSKEDGLITWSEEVEIWSDLAQGSGTTKWRVSYGNPEEGRMPGRGTAVTTIWVEDLGLKSMLHIERTHYGQEPVPGVGNSSVDYEKDFYRHIMEALEKGERQENPNQ